MKSTGNPVNTGEEALSSILDEIEASWPVSEFSPNEVETQIHDSERLKQRADLASRLRCEDEDDLAEALESCGEIMRLHCTCCGDIREVGKMCKRRWCPVCARRISAKRVARFGAAVEQMKWPIFLTLTRVNVRTITVEVIREMQQSFAKLREQRWWKDAVKGGVWSLEVTNRGKGWHPHIHAVMDCRWLGPLACRPKPTDTHASITRKINASAQFVADRWAEALGHKRATVKIKRAFGTGASADPTGQSKPIALEILKYSVKPSDLITAEEPIGDLLRVIRVSRLVSGWGSCYGKKLQVEEEEEPPTMCGCGATGAWLPEEVVDRIIGRPRNYLA